ncbi:MAG: S46 family peptidase [Bacteroidetes bacterium]|nr:S46 family peptidase [Bacteroidota bacterium]
MKYILSFAFLLAVITSRADEGMFPINMIKKAPLAKAGLKVSTDEIYNPNGTGLMQAVVQIGGCTGSFISGQGLIITNHHCAFGGLEPYSTPQNNLLEKGFLSTDSGIELPMKGLTVRILTSFLDVSDKILAGYDTIKSPIKKKKFLEAARELIRKTESIKYPELQIEVSEMLPGKSYMLFRYMLLKDIRIVYIPARNIGEFGGESDNWVWPRHTGDFSLVRAYIGKDGKSSEYKKDNVPYQPKIYFNVSANGLKDDDFVFILGYPGRTFRHQPAEFMNLHEQYQLPYISELYEWEINTIKKLGKTDPNFMLRNEPKIKQLANVMKNYQGKLKAVRKLEQYKIRKEEESKIASILFQNTNPQTTQKYKETLAKINGLYAKTYTNYPKYMWYNQLYSECDMLGIAKNINDFARQYLLVDEKGEAKLIEKYKQLLRADYKTFYAEYDLVFLNKMMEDGMLMKDANTIPSLLTLTIKKPFAKWLEKTYTDSRLLDSTYVFDLMDENPYKFTKIKKKDGFLKLAEILQPDFYVTDSFQTAMRTQLDALMPEYVDFRMMALGQQFIPDANRTLRLTYGHIRGYQPYDGTFYQPFTTVRGMIEKDGLEADYVTNNMIKELIKAGRYGPFPTKDKNDVPLCLLYNTDTTGGNSGSPVLNDQGQLIAINFDRCYEATVNDYNWSENYSRSIGVDMRFVLWTLHNVAKGDNLIKEMYIEGGNGK